MSNQEGHVAGNASHKRPRLSISDSETSSANVQSPACLACLNLDWNLYDEEEFSDGPHERKHFVSFYKIISGKKNGCPSCIILNNALTEFSKPLLIMNVNFVEKLLLSEIIIHLRKGYSTIVEVMEGMEDPVKPYFAIEVYGRQGLLSLLRLSNCLLELR